MYIIQKHLTSVRENLASEVMELAEGDMQSAHGSLRGEVARGITRRKTCMGRKASLATRIQ